MGMKPRAKATVNPEPDPHARFVLDGSCLIIEEGDSAFFSKASNGSIILMDAAIVPLRYGEMIQEMSHQLQVVEEAMEKLRTIKERFVTDTYPRLVTGTQHEELG